MKDHEDVIEMVEVYVQGSEKESSLCCIKTESIRLEAAGNPEKVEKKERNGNGRNW